MALRSLARLGAALSLSGIGRLGATISLLDFVQVGSAISLRSFARLGATLSLVSNGRLGSSLSLLDFTAVGSSFSLRSFARIGSTLSMFRMGRFGSAFSLLDSINLGSSLALRRIARLGSCLSIGHSLAIGIDGVAANMYLRSAVQTNSQFLSSHISFPPQNPGTGASTLHGSWYADAAPEVSDRRLKTHIKPLEIELRRNQEIVQKIPAPKGSTQEVDSGVSWILRELRPVSFRFKSATDTKRLVQNRFGFVAQEIERLSPNMVRTSEKDEPKGLVYQDFLAVLTLAMQEQQERLNRQEEDVQRAQEEVQDFLDQAEILEHLLDALEANATKIRQFRELDAHMSD